MSETLINIYDDDLSELILDDINFYPNQTELFHNLGEVPEGGWTEYQQEDGTLSPQRYQNSSYLEMHVFDESDTFLLTLNSGKPLLTQPSTGKYYFGDW